MALKRGHGAVQNALSPKEALAIEPALAGAVGLEGVIHSPEDEVGDPFRFATGLLDVLVRDYGVETYFGFDADRLRIERGAVGITDAASATISGNRLAVCLGVAAPHFLRKARSEEHTSELKSLKRISYAVFRLKTKKQKSETK